MVLEDVSGQVLSIACFSADNATGMEVIVAQGLEGTRGGGTDGVEGEGQRFEASYYLELIICVRIVLCEGGYDAGEGFDGALASEDESAVAGRNYGKERVEIA